MKDPIERITVLETIQEFQDTIFHDENLTKDNEHDWQAAYCISNLYDKIYRLPGAMPKQANQIVKHHGWAGEYHTCSKCKKIIPFVDWCQPYCSGCGARFKNYYRWCEKKEKKDET